MIKIDSMKFERFKKKKKHDVKIENENVSCSLHNDVRWICIFYSFSCKITSFEFVRYTTWLIQQKISYCVFYSTLTRTVFEVSSRKFHFSACGSLTFYACIAYNMQRPSRNIDMWNLKRVTSRIFFIKSRNIFVQICDTKKKIKIFISSP